MVAVHAVYPTSGGHSVWWVWTPSVTGRVKIDTCTSNFDTQLGIYTGSPVSALEPRNVAR